MTDLSLSAAVTERTKGPFPYFQVQIRGGALTLVRMHDKAAAAVK
jgi:hypothetical protein